MNCVLWYVVCAVCGVFGESLVSLLVLFGVCVWCCVCMRCAVCVYCGVFVVCWVCHVRRVCGRGV